MSAIVDGTFHMAYLRRFFQGTGAVRSIWDDITCQPDSDEEAGVVIIISLTGETPVPQEVIDELTEDCPPGVKLFWRCSVTERLCSKPSGARPFQSSPIVIGGIPCKFSESSYL